MSNLIVRPWFNGRNIYHTPAFLCRSRAPARHSSSVPPYSRPGPPPLPSHEQKEWEDLIRRKQLPAAAPASSSHLEKEVELQLHPDARRPVQPDFEGETNPATGEIGGPKKEPLQWGANGEWTYGGRSTDF